MPETWSAYGSTAPYSRAIGWIPAEAQSVEGILRPDRKRWSRAAPGSLMTWAKRLHLALRHGTWEFGGPRLHGRAGSTSRPAMTCLAMVLAPAFRLTSFQWATPISDRTGTSA